MAKKPVARAGAKPGVFARLASLYDRMGREYDGAAASIGLDCRDCDDNCCVSFFRHHTYIEWSWLWRGMLELDPTRRERFLARAKEVVDEYAHALALGVKPKVPCPLLEDGRCGLHGHRLMICRLHGVPHTFPKPDGSIAVSPGCPKAEALAAGADAPPLDRAPLYQELAKLELDYLGPAVRTLPRVDKTLAEMLLAGPPRLPKRG